MKFIKKKRWKTTIQANMVTNILAKNMRAKRLNMISLFTWWIQDKTLATYMLGFINLAMMLTLSRTVWHFFI